MEEQIQRPRKGSSWAGWLTALGMMLMAVLVYMGIRAELFTSQEALEAFLLRMGILAPLLFILIQIVQVVIPILPGAIGCLAGVLIFGPFWGFLYNYIGICLGSVIVFFLSRNYGKPFVLRMVKEKNYQKYVGWLDKGKAFDRCFAAAIFFPLAPDDLLCYLAGLTSMKAKRFTGIIFLGKPVSIALYSMGLYVLGDTVLKTFG